MDLLGLIDIEGLNPGNVGEPYCGIDARVMPGCGQRCRPRHFQVNHARQDFAQPLPIHAHEMVGQKKLIAGQVGGVALPGQVRGVFVEQRMPA